MEKGKGVAVDVVEPGAAAEEGPGEEEEEGTQERGGSTGSSSSSSWKAGLGALVAGKATAAAASASAVVHFVLPTPLASRPARFLPSSQASSALKSSWIKRLRGLQWDGDPSGKEGKQIVKSGPADGEGSRPQQQQQRRPRLEQQQQYQDQVQVQEEQGKAAGGDGTVTAGMDSDTGRVRVFGSGILAPGSRSGGMQEPVKSPELQQPVEVVGIRRRGGGDEPAQLAVPGGETMILSRRVEVPDFSRPPVPAADTTADHTGKGKDVRRMVSANTESELSMFRNGGRTTAQKVTFAHSTKDSTDRRMEPRKRRPPQDLESEGGHPFRFSQMDTVLEDAAAAPEQVAGASSGFGIFRLGATSVAAPKSMGPPSKRPTIASFRSGKMSMGSFAFSNPDKSNVPKPPPSAPVEPVPVTVAQPSSASRPGPAAAGGGSFVPPTSAELTVWKAKPEKKASFQLLKSDITREEESERLQRRNGQLLESMLANRQAEKGKDLFWSARTGASQSLPPRSSMRGDGGYGGYTSGFVSYVKNLQSEGVDRAGDAARRARASTSYQPGTSFDGTGAEGSMGRDCRQHGGRMREVFQDTEPGDAKPSQRHADTLSRLWQGIAEQPSLLTPLFAPYKAVDEGLENSKLPSNDLRGEEPSPPLTPLFSPFKYPQDDGSQARRTDRPPLPRRVDAPPSFPFTFSATSKRPAAASPNIRAPPPGSAAVVPEDFGRNMNQDLRGDGLRSFRPTVSVEAPNKFESQSSHFSNSPWPPEEARLGVYEEAGSRSNVQGFGAPSRPSASGGVRGLRPGLEHDQGSARSEGPSAFNNRKHRGPASREQGGPSADPRATHAWVPEVIGQTLLQRYTAEPGDSSGSTPPLLPPKTGLGMKYAGFNNPVPIEPLIVPSQSLQAGGGDLQIPSSPKVPKMMDLPRKMPRRGHPLQLREHDVAAGSSMFESTERGSAVGSERPARPVRRNVLNEVEAEGPSYITSRAPHHSSSKSRSFPSQPAMADGDAEDGDQAVRPRLSQTWINRWLPANSALPSCQPSNSKSAARPPAERPRINTARTAHQRSSGNVRLSSFDQPAGPMGQGRRQDRGHMGDHSGGFESGRDRWFHAISDGATPSGSGPSAAAMAIVGRAMRNLTSTSPMLWRQGASTARPSDSYQASASGHSEQQRR